MSSPPIRSSPLPGADSPQPKRQRTDEDGNTSQPLTSSSKLKPPTEATANPNDAPAPHQHMPPALKLVAAIKAVTRLHIVGYSPSQMDRAGDEILKQRDGRFFSREHVKPQVKLLPQEVARQQHNDEIMEQLTEIHAEHVNNVASGYLDKPFTIKITLPGCAFNGTISPPTKFDRSGEADLTSKMRTALNKRIKGWYDHGIVSGYGDLREQVTKVDDKVRTARDIPASDFIVDPELLERIADLWDQNFFPNTKVRVEPYKIHIYGPGGHFKPHRDTPEKDLVGTFLLGLGDPTDGGGLFVNQRWMSAHEAHWCAFYPDVPHAVEEVRGGHRAVIAFKLFRTSTTVDTAETATSLAVRQQVSELVGQMKRPFGIMLEGKYCLGTTEFTGFDALLLASAQAQLGAAVRHLPVVVKSKTTWGAESEYSDFTIATDAEVYPFTPGHVESLIEHGAVEDTLNITVTPDDGTNYGSNEITHDIDHTSCGAPWLEGVKQVPFYSLNLQRSLCLIHKEEVEECEYTGNESRPGKEDSVYLSYAMLVLPPADSKQPTTETKAAGKKKADGKRKAA